MSYLTPHIQEIFQADPNDYDFKYASETGFGSEQIVNQGLVEFLADRFKAKKENPRLIALELAKYQQKTAQKPSNFYIRKVFTDHPKIHAAEPDLHLLFVKAFAFMKAADVSQRRTQVYFSERKISDGKTAYDCLFPEKTPNTTTAINSLFIDITSLANGKEQTPIYLQSTLGEALRLQAISDRNLGVLTFDPRQPAAKGDFARTISFFTLGGRCYQKGWLQKIQESLQRETRSKHGDIPLSQVVAQQLISRLVDHHHNEPAVLVTLAFNASALLLWLNAQYHEEIQKLWCLIFGHLDKLEENFPHQMSQPLIEDIQMMLRDPQFNFKDLYAQIQISSSIDQHRYHAHGNYPNEPTQTNGEIFNQIKIAIPHRKGKNTQTSFALLFPYDLPYAIEHLKTIVRLPSQVEISLARFHKVLVDPHSLEFSFEGSRLKAYVTDPRRQHRNCVIQIRELLRTKHPYTWFMGYLLSLAMLAQQNDDGLSHLVFKSLLVMLQEKWASLEIKQSAIDILHRTLKRSTKPHEPLFAGYDVSKSFLSENYINRWIQVFLTMDWKPLLEASIVAIDQMTPSVTPDGLMPFYKGLMDICLKTDPAGFKARPLKDILTKMIAHTTLTISDKLQSLLSLSQQDKVINNQELKLALFENMEALLKSLKVMPPDVHTHIKGKMVDNIVQFSLQIGPSENPFKWLTLAKEVFRLKLADNADSLKKYWGVLLQFTPQASELAYIYQERAVAFLKEYNLWESLDTESKETFSAQYITHLQQHVAQSGNSNALLNTNSMVILNKHDQENKLRLLKDSLYRMLDQVSPFTNDDFCICLTLLEKIIAEEGFKADVVFPTLIKLSEKDVEPPLNAIRHTLNTVQNSLHDLDMPNRIKHDMGFLTQLESTPSTPPTSAIYTAWMENLLVQLTIPQEPKGLSKAHFKQLANGILKAIQWPQYNHRLSELLDQQVDVLLTRLHKRSLWPEIVELYLAIPSLSSKHCLSTCKTFIEACRQSPQKLAKDIPFDQVHRLLDQIPPEIKSELRNEFDSLYGICFDICEDHRDYPSALRCLEMQNLYSDGLDDFYYQRLFRMAHKLIPTEYARFVYQPLMALETPAGYESTWMGLIQLLLKTNHMALCLDIIKKKAASIGIQEAAFKNNWLTLLAPLLQLGEELFHAEDKTRLKQREHLYRILDQLIWHCLPSDPQAWTSYIRMAAEKGPIDIVEDLFLKIPKEGFTQLPIEKSQRMEYWKWILERFTKDSSVVVLDINSWWPTLLNDIATTPKKEHRPVLGSCISAAHKAIENKRPTTALLNLAKQFSDHLYTNDINMRVMYDAAEDNPRLFVYFSEICLFVDEEDYFERAVLIMISSFVFHRIDPITEEAAINFLNISLEMAPKYVHKEQINNKILNLIKLVTSQTKGADAHLFPILKYLHQIERRDGLNGFENNDIPQNENIELNDPLLDYVTKLEKNLHKAITDPKY